MFHPKLNRQPGPLNEDALQMLRDKGLKKFTKVKTSKDDLLGETIQIHLRKDEIDVDLKLYAAYLEVASLQFSTHFYVPTDFITDYDPQKGEVVLDVDLPTIQRELWDREPTFVAGHQGDIEVLAN